MPAKKRRPYDIARDRAFISKYYSYGHSIQSCTKLLNEHNSKEGIPYTLSWQLIGKEVLIIRRQLTRKASKLMENYVATELEKLSNLEIDILEQWERSKEDKQRIMLTGGHEVGGRNVGAEIKQREVTNRDADIRFIEALLRIGDRKDKLLGIQTNIKADFTLTEKKQVTYVIDAD